METKTSNISTEKNAKAKKNYELQWKEFLAAQGQSFHYYAAWAVITVYPCWTLFDYYFAPWIWQQFGAARFLGSFVILLAVLGHKYFSLSSTALGYVWSLVMYLSIAFMMPLTGKSMWIYFLGYSTCYIVSGMIHFWEIKHSVISVLLALTANVIAFSWYGKEDISTVLGNGGFLTFSVAVVSLMLLISRMKMARENFLLTMEIEEKNKELAINENKLRQKNEEMDKIFANINQGICTIDQDFAIYGEYSRFLELIVKQGQLNGKSVFDLIFQNSQLGKEAKDQIIVVIKSCIEYGQIGFELNKHLLPREIVQAQQTYEVDWVPIESIDGDVIERVMLVVRDVTEFRSAKLAAERSGKEITVLGQILKNDLLEFSAIVESNAEFYQKIKGAASQIDDVKRQSVLRNLHTLKGNCRTYDLTYISNCVHEIEDKLAPITKNDLFEQALNSQLPVLHEEVTIYQKTYNEKVKLGLENYRQKINGASGSAGASGTFGTMLRSLENKFAEMAANLNKKTPTLKIAGDFTLSTQDKLLWEGVLVHLIRNSMDHGFKQNADNEIKVSIEKLKSGFPKITYGDNGVGINTRKILEKGLQNKMIAADASLENIAELIFAPGLSSKDSVSDISGRGIGMDAVRDMIKDMGGEIKIVLLSTQNAEGYTQFKFEIIINKVVEFKQAQEARKSA